MSLTPPVTLSDHTTGNPQALIQLVEYGDFECPHCGRAYPIIKELHEAMSPDIDIIFRPFPLTKVHPHAQQAAVAAEAASRQGKFWEMHDTLFENQHRLTKPALNEYAEMIGLDIERFSADIVDKEIDSIVTRFFMSGLRSGVNATPYFFINGQKYLQSWENDNLIKHLQKMQNELFERQD